MPNPLLNNGNERREGIPIADIIQMLNGSQNPAALMNMLAQQNPQVAQAMNMCRGKNPRDVFFAECKNRGIDPNEIIARYRA